MTPTAPLTLLAAYATGQSGQPLATDAGAIPAAAVAEDAITVAALGPAPAAVQALTTALQGENLARILAGYSADLKRATDNKHSTYPMMLARGIADHLLRLDKIQLEGEAKAVLLDKDVRIDTVKTLLLLNVLKYENRDLFATHGEELRVLGSHAFFSRLADILRLHWQLNEHRLEQQTREAYQAVIATDNVLHTYGILLSWAQWLFPEIWSAFGRRLQEFALGDSKTLLAQMRTQITTAKAQLRALDAQRVVAGAG